MTAGFFVDGKFHSFYRTSVERKIEGDKQAFFKIAIFAKLGKSM